jgi:transcriptional regulator GlxA family with amidase domain
MSPKVIGFLGYDGVTALDIVGPMEAFAAAGGYGDGHGYEVLIVGLTDGPFTSESGIDLRPHRTVRDAALRRPSCSTSSSSRSTPTPGGCSPAPT